MRWALAPMATPRLYRRIRLATVRSYDEMVEREQALAGYQVWLKQKYGGDLSEATEIERLPMTMAPRGYTVEQPLDLPAMWEAEAAERTRQEAEQARQRAKADRIAALTDEADVVEAEHQVAARTGTAAQAEAEAAVRKTTRRQPIRRSAPPPAGPRSSNARS